MMKKKYFHLASELPYLLKIMLKITFLALKSPISPGFLEFRQNRRFWRLKIADFWRLAIYRQGKNLIAISGSKIADLAIYRQKWQHWMLAGISEWW